MHLASTNLAPHHAGLLRQELAALEADAPSLALSVVDLSAGHDPLPPGVSLQPSAAAPPVDIAARWQWDARRQSYQLLREGDTIHVLGAGPEGALYGFYRVLHDLAGRRWYSMAADEDLAGLPPRELPAGIITPDVPWRGFEGALAKWTTPFIASLFRWMLRNGWNLVLLNAGQWAARDDRAEIARLAELHAVRLVIGGHAADHFLPEELFATHPEYFGLRDGVRCTHCETSFPDIPGQAHRLPVQPCYASPATRDFIAGRIAAFIDATPELTAFSLWPHDGSNNWCQCPLCLASTPYAMMHELARAILARLRRPVPIEILAYCNLLDPPRAPLNPDPRIYTLFCPYLRHYRHRFDDPGFPPHRLTLGTAWPQPEPVNPLDDREYGLLLEQWLPHLDAARSGLGIFAYYQLAFVDETRRSDRSRYLYHPAPDLVAYELQTYHGLGMGVFYDCSWPLPGFWPDARYYAYFSQLLWHVGADPRQLIDTYYREAFGKLGSALQTALAKLAAVLDQPDRPPVPAAALDAVRKTLADDESPRADRLRLWLDYVALADQSWQLRRQGRDNAAAESAIQSLLTAHQSLLAPNLQVDWLLRLSRGMKA